MLKSYRATIPITTKFNETSLNHICQFKVTILWWHWAVSTFPNCNGKDWTIECREKEKKKKQKNENSAINLLYCCLFMTFSLENGESEEKRMKNPHRNYVNSHRSVHEMHGYMKLFVICFLFCILCILWSEMFCKFLMRWCGKTTENFLLPNF